MSDNKLMDFLTTVPRRQDRRKDSQQETQFINFQYISI